jgi:hypothetical protein
VTYATHQEAASRALRRMLSADPSDLDGDGDVVLQCREHVIAALTERLNHLGGVTSESGPKVVRIDSLGRQPLVHLAGLLAALDRTGPGPTAPSDLLPGPSAEHAHSPTDLWRCVARELMLGNHELTAAAKQPWTHKPEAGWYVLADTASSIEALVVLDHKLGEVGLLPVAPSDRVLARRLVAGDVARMAGWFGTDDSADLATQSINASLGLGGGPRVHMVRRVAGFAAAQRALAGFLRPTLVQYETGSAGERPGLLAARALAVGQIRLAEASARWAGAYGGAGAVLAEGFRARIPAYRDLHQSTLRLVEVEPRRSPLVLAQQSEMVMQLRAVRPERLTRRGLVDLSEATHEVAITLGSALRREGMQRKNILTLESRGMGLPEPRPITNRHRGFHAACSRLASDPAPTITAASWGAPVERERLRAALEGTPSGPVRPVRHMPAATARASAPGLHLGR